MVQITLPLLLENDSSANDDFIVSLCNMEAYRAIINNHQMWPNNRLLLLGEQGSGKSHLAKMWAKETGASLFQAPFQQPLYQQFSNSILIENLDQNFNENEIFHIINYCSTENISLLITARVLPHFSLPDLRSRINATYKVLIKQPDDELILMLLKKYFFNNQILVDHEVLDYLSNRIERSFATVNDITKKIDSASLRHKKPITVPLVKALLNELL